MAYQDSNPERRNLTLLSISIIVFFLADGEFSDTTVRLQLVNATFNKPEILVYFVWGALIWFCYRYWVTSKGTWKRPLYEELTINTPDFLLDTYLVRRFSLQKNDFTDALSPNRHHVGINHNLGTELYFSHISLNRNTSNNSTHKHTNIKIETFSDRGFIAICSIYVSLVKPTISGHFVPYFLFVWAVCLGMWNFLSNL